MWKQRRLGRERRERAAELAEDVARLEGFWAPGHPYTALHRLRCAKLQNLVGNEREAQVHIMLALVRLVVSHGKESSLAKEAADMLEGAGLEGFQSFGVSADLVAAVRTDGGTNAHSWVARASTAWATRRMRAENILYFFSLLNALLFGQR